MPVYGEIYCNRCCKKLDENRYLTLRTYSHTNKDYYADLPKDYYSIKVLCSECADKFYAWFFSELN